MQLGKCYLAEGHYWGQKLSDGHANNMTMPNGSYLKWVIPLLVTIGLAANGMTLNWINAKFDDHNIQPHVGSATKDEYKHLRQDVKDLDKKLDNLTTHIIQLEIAIGKNLNRQRGHNR